jgi:GTP-binding protein Era
VIGGFVCLAGRPSVGKSSLLNALVDADVSIVSNKPETTRKAIRGILTNQPSVSGGVAPYPELPDFQIVFVDTPGIHRPRTLLGERLNAVTDEQLTTVDVILFLTPADEQIGPGDRHIIKHLAQMSSKHNKLVAVVTKTDKITPDKLVEHLISVDQLEGEVGVKFDAIVPTSARTDNNIEDLLRVVTDYLPESELLYSADQLTDESWQDMVSEVVRGAALESLNQELPHSLMVQINERVDDTIYVNLFVERDSQKGIILGKGGENIKRIRKSATKLAREIIGEDDVKLNLQVKIAKDWQRNPKTLQKFGF